MLCSTFHPSKCTHSSEHWTHTQSSGQPFLLWHPVNDWGLDALIKGTTVVGSESGGELCSLTTTTYTFPVGNETRTRNFSFKSQTPWKKSLKNIIINITLLFLWCIFLSLFLSVKVNRQINKIRRVVCAVSMFSVVIWGHNVQTLSDQPRFLSLGITRSVWPLSTYISCLLLIALQWTKAK